jgi:tRNA-binding protein
MSIDKIEPVLPAITPEQFFACDLRAGTIIACELNAKARKPSYKLTIDFGPLGTKTSSAQLTGLYAPEQLLGRQVIAVMNFPPRNVAGVESQCLVLGVDTPDGVALLALERVVENGSRVY